MCAVVATAVAISGIYALSLKVCANFLILLHNWFLFMAPFEGTRHNFIVTLLVKIEGGGGEELCTEKSRILHLSQFTPEPATVFIN